MALRLEPEPHYRRDYKAFKKRYPQHLTELKEVLDRLAEGPPYNRPDDRKPLNIESVAGKPNVKRVWIGNRRGPRLSFEIVNDTLILRRLGAKEGFDYSKA